MRFIYIKGKNLTHDALAEAFAFPPHYGRNLDALFDCLTEIAAHTMIVLTDSDQADGRFLNVIRAAVAENPRLCIVMM